MVPGAEFLAEFRGWAEDRVYFPSEARLDRPEGVDDFKKRDRPYNEHVDVARVPQLPACRRSEHERDSDPAAESRQRLAQDIGDTRGLGEQAIQLREDGRRPLRLEVDLPTADSPAQQARRHQSPQFALNGTMAGTGAADDFPEMEFLVRAGQEPSQNTPAGYSEQDGGWIRDRATL